MAASLPTSPNSTTLRHAKSVGFIPTSPRSPPLNGRIDNIAKQAAVSPSSVQEMFDGYHRNLKPGDVKPTNRGDHLLPDKDKDLLQRCLYLDCLVDELGELHRAEVAVRVETEDNAWLGTCLGSCGPGGHKCLISVLDAHESVSLKDLGVRDREMREKLIKTYEDMVAYLRTTPGGWE